MTFQDTMDLIDLAKTYAEDGAYATAAAQLRAAAEQLDHIHREANEMAGQFPAN